MSQESLQGQPAGISRRQLLIALREAGKGGLALLLLTACGADDLITQSPVDASPTPLPTPTEVADGMGEDEQLTVDAARAEMQQAPTLQPSPEPSPEPSPTAMPEVTKTVETATIGFDVTEEAHNKFPYVVRDNPIWLNPEFKAGGMEGAEQILHRINMVVFSWKAGLENAHQMTTQQLEEFINQKLEETGGDLSIWDGVNPESGGIEVTVEGYPPYDFDNYEVINWNGQDIPDIAQ